MSEVQNIELNKALHQMQQTNSQSDNLIKNPQICQQNFQKIREKLHWKITLNYQIDFIGKYILYELIQTTRYYDLYRAYKILSKERVIVKIIDKYTIKQSLIQNEVLQNWEEQFNEFIQKQRIQHSSIKSLMNLMSSIFLIENQQIYENSQCMIKISQNYYDQSLQKILKRRGSLPIQQALAVIKFAIYTLSQFHKKNIILTELNPSFIIYKNGVFKISDLSSMRKVSHKFKSTINLHHQYLFDDLVAPEVTVCPQMVNIKSQMWALGVLFYTMIAHYIPYEQRRLDIVKKAKAHNVSCETRTGQASEEVICFLRQLLQTDPDERISWKKLANHSIFKNQQYFFNPKMMPLVDTRSKTLSKKQNDIISDDITNLQFNSNLLNANNEKYLNLINELNKQKWLFRTVDQDKKIDLVKSLDIEAQTFYYIQQMNLMALKANYIFNQILLKLQKYHMTDKKRRSHIETIQLISQRCYQNIRKIKILQNKSADRRIDNYVGQLKQLYNNIKDFHDKAWNKYKQVDNSTYYISTDIFSSVLNKSKLKQKQRIIRGNQGLQFTLDQQIHYTQEKCINKMITQLKGQQTILEYVKINLKNYEKINHITMQDLKNQFSFSDVVTKIINNGDKKYNK